MGYTVFPCIEIASGIDGKDIAPIFLDPQKKLKAQLDDELTRIGDLDFKPLTQYSFIRG